MKRISGSKKHRIKWTIYEAIHTSVLLACVVIACVPVLDLIRGRTSNACPENPEAPWVGVDLRRSILGGVCPRHLGLPHPTGFRHEQYGMRRQCDG